MSECNEQPKVNDCKEVPEGNESESNNVTAVPDYVELAKTSRKSRKKMTNHQLLQKVAARSDFTPEEIKRMFAVLQNVVAEELASGKDILLMFLGRIKLKYIPARNFINPVTGSVRHIEGRCSVSLSASKELKAMLSEVVTRLPPEDQINLLSLKQIRKLIAEGDLPVNNFYWNMMLTPEKRKELELQGKLPNTYQGDKNE